MALMSGNDWSNGKRSIYDEPAHPTDEFDRQEGKPVKALIGIILLVVIAVVLSRMNPASHDISGNPAITTGQTTGLVR